MRIAGKIFLSGVGWSGLAWPVITLSTAATVEITMGERRSGLIHHRHDGCLGPNTISDLAASER